MFSNPPYLDEIDSLALTAADKTVELLEAVIRPAQHYGVEGAELTIEKTAEAIGLQVVTRIMVAQGLQTLHAIEKYVAEGLTLDEAILEGRAMFIGLYMSTLASTEEIGEMLQVALSSLLNAPAATNPEIAPVTLEVQNGVIDGSSGWEQPQLPEELLPKPASPTAYL